MQEWTDKIRPPMQMLLAPVWYLQAKAEGWSQEQLKEAVRAACLEQMPDEDVTEALVDLTIMSYEA